MRRLLSGNEAIAHAAWEAGVVVGAGYPGTPSTEILEEFARYPDVYAEWSPNEKVALDVAIGAAYAGRRAVATMKHVGLNVALDSFWSVSMTGVEAGLVVVVADDPSLHSSQNEQDTRHLARWARVPCLDPSDSQDAHDLTVAAFEISERFDTPVLLRPTTRVCHTSSPVEVGEVRDRRPVPAAYVRNVAKYDMAPAHARLRRPLLEERVAALAEFAESFPHTRVEWRGTRLGIVASGVAYHHAREVFPDASILKLGLVHPLPRRLLETFAAGVERLVVLEELDPVVEDQVRLLGLQLFRPELPPPHPQTKSVFPVSGELDSRIVREAAVAAGLLPPGMPAQAPVPAALHHPPETTTHTLPAAPAAALDLAPRPPTLCPGCPHRSSFFVLHKLGVTVNGDIGCYTLGMAEPLDALHTAGCMGASIGVAHGGAVAGDPARHVAVIGDSTFFHSGLPALVDVLHHGSDVVTVILDNRITGMTGHQDNPGTGVTLQGRPAVQVDLERVVRALGFPDDKVATLPAYDVAAIERQLRAWLAEPGPAVLVARQECALLPSARARYLPLAVTDACNGCTICFRIGCPSILHSDVLDERTRRPLALIDAQTCTGCEICARVCPRDAILFREQVSARA